MSGRPASGPLASPVLFIRAPTTYEFFRFNRVEGIYTGVAGTVFFRDTFPGLALRGGIGYGCWDQEVEGRPGRHPATRGRVVRRADGAARARHRHQVPGSARLRDGNAADLRAGPVRLRRSARRPGGRRLRAGEAPQRRDPGRSRGGEGQGDARRSCPTARLGQDYYPATRPSIRARTSVRASASSGARTSARTSRAQVSARRCTSRTARATSSTRASTPAWWHGRTSPG